MKTSYTSCLLAIVLFGMAAHATPVLVLTPVLALGGATDTVGWGYQIVNDTANYLLIDSSDFCGASGDPQFTPCGPNNGVDRYDGLYNFGPAFGVYNDYIATNFTIVAPNTTTPFQSFSPGNPTGTGVGGYTIDANTPLFSIDSGTIFVSYQQYDGDPLNGGGQVAGDIFMTAAAQVEVTPEPATFGLAALALLAFAARRRRPRRT